ncbi:MAG: hypothetical protein ACRD2G_12800 [Terriglobia bacterium]
MKLGKRTVFPIASAFLCAALACAQGSYKVTSGSAPAAVPAPLQAVLESQGGQFMTVQGAPVCEIWWRKGIPVQKSAGGSPDVLYGGLSMGELVGVVNFPAAAKDFRGQAIKPGYYTLRYALIPQDGNHMGVSAYSDFLLLVTAANDANPSRNMTFDEVVKASRLATGTGHPGILMLDPPSQAANAAFPGAFQDDQGNWALEVKLDTGGGQQLPFAIVLEGQYQG